MSAISVFVSIAGVVINACLLVLVILQLKSSNSATREDHNRRRKQASIEWFAVTLQQRAQYVDALPQDQDAAAIAKFLKRVNGRPDLNIIGYLNVHETLATAINMEIHDFELIERLSGTRIIRLYRAYEPWIDYRRKVLNSHPYVELETLTVRLEESAKRRSKQEA